MQRVEGEGGGAYILTSRSQVLEGSPFHPSLSVCVCV